MPNLEKSSMFSGQKGSMVSFCSGHLSPRDSIILRKDLYRHHQDHLNNSNALVPKNLRKKFDNPGRDCGFLSATRELEN